MPKKSVRLRSEVAGVLFIALTPLLFLSLISADSSKNYIGLIGTEVAKWLFDYFGSGAYLFPLLTLKLSIGCFRRSKTISNTAFMLGSISLLLSVCGLISVFFSSPTLSGGRLGDELIKPFLLPYLNSVGTSIVLATLLIISIILTTGFSLTGVAEKLKAIFARSTPAPRAEKSKPQSHITPEISTGEIKEQTIPVINTHKVCKTSLEDERPATASPAVAGDYQYPPLSLLDPPKHLDSKIIQQELVDNSLILETKLRDFNVHGHIVEVHPGPVITRYEFEPAPGIKINKVINLADDLAVAMKAASVRVIAPIPGKSVVGIEVPNKQREIISLVEVLSSDNFRRKGGKLALALGKDTAGNPYVTDLTRMPHLLVAGATGSGKSVTLNTIICSILYNASPARVRLVMLDPKMLELGVYDDIPHLLVPVVTDVKKAAGVLYWAIEQMEERYRLLADKGVRNIDQYNEYIKKDKEAEPLPYIVMIIDEFADLIMTTAKEVETLITRLAQMSRAVGIHMIIATQRPSVDVITGIIKANFPCRISFKVSSRTDSRTILDTMGAEKLLGLGDMLFVPPGSSEMLRLHGALVTEKEISRVVKFMRRQGQPQYDTSLLEASTEAPTAAGSQDDYDEIYDQAVEFAVQRGEISISMLQRYFRVGYNRAARMVEVMER